MDLQYKKEIARDGYPAKGGFSFKNRQENTLLLYSSPPNSIPFYSAPLYLILLFFLSFSHLIGHVRILGINRN